MADRPNPEQVAAALARADLVHNGGTNEVRCAIHVLAAEVRALRDDFGMEMGMRAAALDELETLRRRLWALLDADQLSDDDAVDRLCAALAARSPQEPTPAVGDLVEYAEDGGVLGKVTAVIAGKVAVEFPNGVATGAPSEFAVVRTAAALARPAGDPS